MKLNSALAIVAALTLFCGCADETVNPSAQIRSASATETDATVKTYKVRVHYLNLGSSFTEVQHTVIGTITIDVKNNQILWDQIPLKLVKPDLFFVTEGVVTAAISIKGRSLEEKTAVAISRDASCNGHTFVELCQTPNGSYDEFYSQYNQLKFPENYHGLIAFSKYVDGTPVGICYELVASIQLVGKGCLLNEKDARFYRSTLENGNGVIVINNGNSNLILWPDGNWIFYDLNNSSTRFSGVDNLLMQTYSNLHQRTEDAVSSNPTAVGTGFFITEDGYLISNYHVVKEATKIRLVTSAGTVDAKVVQVDAANDLALLKADGKFSPLPIAASRTAHLGGTVATIGFPDPSLQGFSPKLAKGEIASLSGAGDDPRYFQISVPVQPGNSGGALVDERGNVIGIVSAKLDAAVALAASGSLPENVNYAVKSSLLLSFLESVPDVDAKLKAPVTVDRQFEDVVKSAQAAAVLVLVY